MKCINCKKEFDYPEIKGNGNFRYHPFLGEIEDTVNCCPYCRSVLPHGILDIDDSIRKGIVDIKEGRVTTVNDIDKFFEEL